MIYANLSVPYEALTNAPAELGAGILNSLSGGDVTNLYDGIDDLYSQALNVGQAISQNGGWLAGALTSVIMFLVAAAMATITIIVLSAAKIMLAVLVAIAPVAVACTLFKQSAPLFEAWVKLAIGFAFVPLFVAAMAGFTIATGEAVAPRDPRQRRNTRGRDFVRRGDDDRRRSDVARANFRARACRYEHRPRLDRCKCRADARERMAQYRCRDPGRR